MTCLLINDQDGYKKLATIAKIPLEGMYVVIGIGIGINV